jgi:transcriptional regulator with XRE-family HTH domain
MAKRKHHIEHADIVKGFAIRLREARRAKGMTQANLARASHISESYLRRLEAAGAAPGIDLLDRLATALGTTPADLLPPPGPRAELAVFREQIRRQIESLLQTNDAQTLGLLVQFLARLSETTPRSSS